MEVKVFGSTRGNNYKSICAQCNLKRKKKSDPSRRNKRKYIFVPAAWATQALSRQCWNLPKTVHTLLQCNHSPASASPLPPHAQVYQQESTRTQEPYLSPRNATVSKWQRDGWIPWPLSGSFAQVQRGRWGPMFPVQSLLEEMRSGFHGIASKRPLQSRYSFNTTH